MSDEEKARMISGIINVYERICLEKKNKVDVSIEAKRIAKVFNVNPKFVWDIISKHKMPPILDEKK